MPVLEIPKKLKIAISGLAILLIILHIIFPQRVGTVVVVLLLILITPWIFPYVKRIPTPWGDIELREILSDYIPKEIVEEKLKELYPVEVKNRGEELEVVEIDPLLEAKTEILNELLEYENDRIRA